MKSWNQPPDLHYSFKSHFTWPNPPPMGGAAAGAAEAAAAGAAGAGGGGVHPPYGGTRGYYHGYGRGYHWRPRFGLFRRAVWFGLGVAAASWYIHRKQERNESRRGISAWNGMDRQAIDNLFGNEGSAYSLESKTHEPRSSQRSAPYTTPNFEATGEPVMPVQQPIEKKCGWAGRWEAKRREKEEAAALKMEAEEIKAAIGKAWADRKKEAEALQDKANDRAREYAKEKLEILSKAVEKMREALSEDLSKDGKLV